VLQLPNIMLLNVDQLSKLKDETLQKRLAEVPKAKQIIAEYKAEFLEWASMRKNAPVIRLLSKSFTTCTSARCFFLLTLLRR